MICWARQTLLTTELSKYQTVAAAGNAAATGRSGAIAVQKCLNVFAIKRPVVVEIGDDALHERL
jgi:hypothetical protein